MSKINFNVPVTIEELRTAIPLIAEELTVVVLSEPGCGKTSLLSMIAADNGDKWRSPKDGNSIEGDKFDYIYVDCPVKDMSDIGMTIPNHASKTLEYYVASLFNMKDSKPKYILLDEMMKAPKMLQVIFMRLALERMVGDAACTKGTRIIATSNNATDGVGDGMLAHGVNRVAIVQMQKPRANPWLKWAGENGISRIIRSWVAANTRCLNSYTDDGQEDNPYIFNPKRPATSFVSPRSLAKCDVIVRNRDMIGDNATTAFLAGTIGMSAAKDMAVYMSLDKKLPSVKLEIIKDPYGVQVPDSIAAQMMIMFEAVDVLETQDEMTKFMQFVKRIDSNEVQTIFFTMAMRTQRTVRLARNNTEISAWCVANHQYM